MFFKPYFQLENIFLLSINYLLNYKWHSFMWTFAFVPSILSKIFKSLIIICIFIIVSPNITHNIMPSLVNYPQKWKRKFKGKHSWWPFLMRGAYADARPGYFHLISVAQLTLNSMRQEDSKWKLMMRTYRVPCVINQHAAGDVSGQCFHLISWTKWGLATYFWWWFIFNFFLYFFFFFNIFEKS